MRAASLQLVGFALMTAGIARWSLSLALVVAGGLLLAAGVLEAGRK